MQEFLTFKSLLTYGGAAAATGALTQLIKPLTEKLPFKIDNRLVSYVTALLIMITATVLSGGRDLSDYLICTVNAALIALSSNGGYDLIKTLLSEKNDGEDDNDENNA